MTENVFSVILHFRGGLHADEIADNINLLCGLTVYLNTLMDYDFLINSCRIMVFNSEIERQIIINCGIQ